MKFNELDKAVLIGLILGDGYIDPKGRIYVNHGYKQKEYCIFKAKLLHSVCGGKDINVEEYNYTYTKHVKGQLIENSTYTAYRFKKQSKHFKYFRELIYKDGKKHITKEILNMLTPLSIALWYMDDGSLVRKQQADKTPGPYQIMLYTYISEEENILIRDYFLEKYNMRWNVVPANIHKENQYMLRCGQTEGRKFLNIVRDIIREKVPSMSYKVLDI